MPPAHSDHRVQRTYLSTKKLSQTLTQSDPKRPPQYQNKSKHTSSISTYPIPRQQMPSRLIGTISPVTPGTYNVATYMTGMVPLKSNPSNGNSTIILKHRYRYPVTARTASPQSTKGSPYDAMVGYPIVSRPVDLSFHPVTARMSPKTSSGPRSTNSSNRIIDMNPMPESTLKEQSPSTGAPSDTPIPGIPTTGTKNNISSSNSM